MVWCSGCRSATRSARPRSPSGSRERGTNSPSRAASVNEVGTGPTHKECWRSPSRRVGDALGSHRESDREDARRSQFVNPCKELEEVRRDSAMTDEAAHTGSLCHRPDVRVEDSQNSSEATTLPCSRGSKKDSLHRLSLGPCMMCFVSASPVAEKCNTRWRHTASSKNRDYHSSLCRFVTFRTEPMRSCRSLR